MSPAPKLQKRIPVVRILPDCCGRPASYGRTDASGHQLALKKSIFGLCSHIPLWLLYPINYLLIATRLVMARPTGASATALPKASFLATHQLLEPWLGLSSEVAPCDSVFDTSSVWLFISWSPKLGVWSHASPEYKCSFLEPLNSVPSGHDSISWFLHECCYEPLNHNKEFSLAPGESHGRCDFHLSSILQ